MSSIKGYAELLLHLRQVTVYASFDSNITEKTSIDLSSDLQSLKIHHEGATACLQLPAKVATNATLKLPTGPVHELSYRLPILGHGMPADLSAATAGNVVEWSADSLTSTTQINCRNCNKILVERSAVSVWKNLPSENWAEMMDFWHCHKPDSEEHDNTRVSNGNTNGMQEGYMANNKLLAKIGVGFVDLAHLLLAKQDCPGIEVQQDNRSRTSPRLICTACHEPSGFGDTMADGWRLWKWSLRLQLNAQSEGQTFQTEMFVSAQLLGLIENQAVRKFVMYDEDGKDGVAGMLLWVFTPDLRYSACTEVQSKHPKRAMKILYQQADNARDVVNKQHTSLEELPLPAHILDSIRVSLRESTALLPLSARKFQNWDVGLLARFDSGS